MKFAAAALCLSLPLTAQTFGSTNAGDGCGGATLTVSFATVGNGGNARIDIHADGLHSDAMCGMIFGIEPAAIGPVLNLPGCYVRTEAIWAQHHFTDATGTWGWSRSWPNSVIGWYLIQVGSLDVNSLDVKISNCVRAAHE